LSDPIILGIGEDHTSSAYAVLSRLVERDRCLASRSVVPTGFVPLDDALDGGLHAGQLIVVGGKPGVGKTVMALQWARNAALQGFTAIYACYEQDEIALVARLLAFELAEVAIVMGISDAARLNELRARVRDVATGALLMRDALASDLLLADAARRVAEYSERLVIVKALGNEADVEIVARTVADCPADRRLLVVDCVEKVPVVGASTMTAERQRIVAQSLKTLAFALGVSVVAVAAVNEDGLRSQRLRLQHLCGSSVLAYQADVIIMMNDKADIAVRPAAGWSPIRVDDCQNRVIVSIEKNRNGLAGIDLEFLKDFESFRLNPFGRRSLDPLWAATINETTST
jgi:replicative DNA helicase